MIIVQEKDNLILLKDQDLVNIHQSQLEPALVLKAGVQLKGNRRLHVKIIEAAVADITRKITITLQDDIQHRDEAVVAVHLLVDGMVPVELFHTPNNGSNHLRLLEAYRSCEIPCQILDR